MKIRTLLVAATALLAVSGATIAYTPSAQAQVDIVIGNAPPPPRIERVPEPRHGYVWDAGHWVWNGHAHVWTAGHWVAERRGYRRVPAQWEQTPRGWHYVPGHWDR